MARPVVFTTLTESLGLFWGLCCIPFLIFGLQRRSNKHLLLGVTSLFVALFIRMGAMFVIPFVILWITLFWGSEFRQRLRNTVAICAVLAGTSIANTDVGMLYGIWHGRIGQIFNFASVLCGMSVGGIWKDCLAKYASELGSFHSESEMAEFAYRVALENILHQPLVFLTSMWNGMSEFLTDLETLPTTWYKWPQVSVFPTAIIYLASIAGWTYIAVRSF